MKKPSVTVLVLLLVGTVVFLFNYKFTDAYIDSPDNLAIELRSPLDSAYIWQISRDVPFKYRMLFPIVVKATWAVVRDNPQDNESFVAVYRFWCYLTMVTAILSFCWLMHVIGFTQQQLLAGGLLFILMPPFSFAFSVPVHTREDLLCYTLLNVGLIALIRERTIFFLLIAVTGVFCRETLLILPFLYFFYAKQNFFIRTIVAGIPGAAWLLMRWITYEKYDAVGDGLGDNLENLFQTCAYLFMSFNVLWLPFFGTLADKKESQDPAFNVIFRTSIPAFLMIFLTTILLGRVMEMRLLYLLAPWLIPVVVYGVSRHGEEMIAYLRSRTLIVVAVGGLLFLSLAYGAVWKVKPELYDMIKGYWWITLFLTAWLTIISVPVLLPLMGRPRTVLK